MKDRGRDAPEAPSSTRRALVRALAAAPAIAVSAPGVARATDTVGAGFQASGLAALEQKLYGLPTTSLLVLQSGKVAYRYGDDRHVSYLASARKSVLSMLYGRYVEAGVIRLDRTLGDLGIPELGDQLSPLERSATIGDLLTSRSGVYLPAATPGSAPTPARGSQAPGTRFVYNNWDFDAAGAIFQRLTGKSVFRALEEDLARPLGFQDFDPGRQRMLRLRGSTSAFSAYHMFLSARDMARLGATMVQGGRWRGRQVVPAAWVRESTTLRVPAQAVGVGAMGYGYLWWLPGEGRTGAHWQGSFLAAGNYGQFLLGLPALDLVIVHRRAVTDDFAIARNLGDTQASPPGVSPDTFLGLADMIVAARR